MGYEQDLAVIELNGLKIAEDRTFADCARHVFASILDLCLPSTASCKAEYQTLFPPDAPDTDTQVSAVLCWSLSLPAPSPTLPVAGGVRHLCTTSAVNYTSAGNHVTSA